LEGSEIDLGGGSDHVSLVNSAKGDTVDLERTGNEEETGRKLTKGNDTLSTESTCEEDDDGSRSDSLTKLGGLVRLARDLGGRERRLRGSTRARRPSCRNLQQVGPTWVDACTNPSWRKPCCARACRCKARRRSCGPSNSGVRNEMRGKGGKVEERVEFWSELGKVK